MSKEKKRSENGTCSIQSVPLKFAAKNLARLTVSTISFLKHSPSLNVALKNIEFRWERKGGKYKTGFYEYL